MAESVTPTRALGKLDSLPKDELIKYIKKQASQVKDLKKKNEDLNLMLKHEKNEMEKLEQEQKSWLSRGVSAEFEKKEELQKKERELQMAAHLGQQMLAENDKLRNRCSDLEQENVSIKEDMGAEIERLDAEKETIEQTLIMIQNEYKEAKLESQKLKEALEIAAADHDKEFEKWEGERKELREKINEFTVNDTPSGSSESEMEESDIKNVLQDEIDKLKEQLKLIESNGRQYSDDITKENQELKVKLEANNVELKAQCESLKVLRTKCQGLDTKNEELHQLVNMVSAERDESNAYSKQLSEEVKALKEEREKMVRSLKTLKGKVEKASNAEEDLKAEVSTLASDKGELQLMVKNLQREKKTLVQSNKKLKEKLRISSAKQGSFDEGNSESSLEKENEELRNEIKLLKHKCENEEELDSLKNNNKDLIKEKEGLKDEISSLMEKLLQQEEELSDKVLKYEGEKAMVVKLQSRVDELLSTLQSLNEEKMHQESEIEELFKTHDELQVKYDKECKDRMENNKVIQQLSDELTKEKDHTMNLQEQLFSLQNVAQSHLISTQNTDDATEGRKEQSETDVVLQKEVESKCMEIEQLKKQLVETEEELELERKQRKVLETNFDEKVSSVDEFEANEIRIASMNDECMEEMERLKKEVDELKKDKGSLEQEMMKVKDSTLQEEFGEVKIRMEKQQKEKLEIEESKRELENKLHTTMQELESQKETVLSLNVCIEQLEKDLQKIEQENKELGRSLEIMKKKFEEKDEDCDKFVQEISELKAKELALNEKMTNAVNSNEQDGIEKYKKAYKKMKEKLNEQGTLNRELKTDLEAKTMLIEELRKELLENQKVLESHVEKDDEEKVHELLKSIEEKDKMILELEIEVKRCKESNESKELSAENKSLEKVEELEVKIERYENERIQLDSKISCLSVESEEMRTKLIRESEINCEQKSEIESINVENMNLKNQLEDLENRMTKLSLENEKLIVTLREFENVNDALKERDLQVMELKTTIEEVEGGKEELSVLNKQLIIERDENERKISRLENDIEMEKNCESERMSYTTQLEDGLSGMKIKMNEYRIEMNEVGKKLMERENEVKEKNIVIKNLENDYRQLEENLVNITANCDEQRKELADTLKERESLLFMKEELSLNLNKKIEEISFLEDRKEEAERQQAAKVDENKSILESEINFLKEKLNGCEELKTEFQRIKGMCEEKDVKIGKYNDTISELEDRLDLVNKELCSTKTEYEKFMAAAKMENNERSNAQEDLKKALAKIESLEEENKEKSEKVNKFKSVAIKAKKEIDSIKGKSSGEKKELEENIENLAMELQSVKESLSQQSQELGNVKEAYEKLANNFDTVSSSLEIEKKRNIDAEDENGKLKSTVDHLQVSLASAGNENASLQSQLKEREDSLIELTKQLNESTSSVQHLQEKLSLEKSEHDAAKEELSKTSVELENAKKDLSQMKMISLEMEDYHRTAQSLQNKLSDSEIDCKDANKRIQELEQDIKMLNEQIASVDEQRNSASQEVDQLTIVVAEKDGEIENLMTEKKDLEEKELNFKQRIEELSAKCEERMIQISEFASEKEKILLQLKTEKDLHQKNISSVESKFSRTRTELSLLQEAYENCKQEFESYKIRAQNVLKQQKMKQSENDGSQFLQEKSRLEKIVEELKTKLKESNAKLSATIADNEDLEGEYEKLQNRYGELVKDISEKEAQWRERFIGIQSEMNRQSTENESKILLLSQEKNSLKEQIRSNEEYETMAQDYEETIKELKDKIARMQSSPKRQNSREKRPATDSDTKEQKTTPEHLKLPTHSLSDVTHGLVERPGAEGMDSSELEAIDKSSLPATPLSADSATILDKILSPSEQQNVWPVSPTASKEEGFRLRYALSTSEKNVEHLTELLAETEGSNIKLTEQIKLLKSEIRRMQQNQEREEALHNLEYLKNVIIKFMKCNTTERECLVPVLSTMLKLTTEEKQFITEFAKGEADQDVNASGWSSYVYKWTSFS